MAYQMFSDSFCAILKRWRSPTRRTERCLAPIMRARSTSRFRVAAATGRKRARDGNERYHEGTGSKDNTSLMDQYCTENVGEDEEEVKGYWDPEIILAYAKEHLDEDQMRTLANFLKNAKKPDGQRGNDEPEPFAGQPRPGGEMRGNDKRKAMDSLAYDRRTGTTFDERHAEGRADQGPGLRPRGSQSIDGGRT